MPDKLFLEEYPLYRKFKTESLPAWADELPKVAINMPCWQCKSNQTFTMTNNYWELFDHRNVDVRGHILRSFYCCQHCDESTRIFYFLIDLENKWIMKVGQFPAWDIKGDAEIEKLLGTHAEYYKKGLVCESQSYGIGAFGYYRRIVEQIIDGLLHEIATLMSGDEQVEFRSALEHTKQTSIAQEKIELVKELLPPILRPDDMNPLGVLYGALSEGLHAESDEVCLEQAAIIRGVLVFLINEVAARKAAGKSFTEGMRKLLEKKAARES